MQKFNSCLNFAKTKRLQHLLQRPQRLHQLAAAVCHNPPQIPCSRLAAWVVLAQRIPCRSRHQSDGTGAMMQPQMYLRGARQARLQRQSVMFPTLRRRQQALLRMLLPSDASLPARPRRLGSTESSARFAARGRGRQEQAHGGTPANRLVLTWTQPDKHDRARTSLSS